MKTRNTTIKRAAKRVSYDPALIKSIINEAIIGHLAFAVGDDTHSIPMPFWIDGDYLYFHCSVQSRLVALATQAQSVSISFTIVDALVLAKSTVKHSMNYRSVVVYGVFEQVENDKDKISAMEQLMRLLLQNRWNEARAPNRKELNATAVLKMPMTEAVAKVRTGPPIDSKKDKTLDVWSGIIPLITQRGIPHPDDTTHHNHALDRPCLNTTPCSTPKMIDLIGDYCTLKCLNSALHCKPLYEALCEKSDDVIWHYLPSGPFDNYNQFKTWLTNINQHEFFYVIMDNTTGIISGLASYQSIDIKNKTIEVGWVIYASYMQRKPFGTEAMYLMMHHAFELGYRRYEWKCDAHNHRSHHAALRLDFQFEGIWRNTQIIKGRNRDTAWHAIIDKDWPELQLRFERWLDADNFNAAGEQICKL